LTACLLVGERGGEREGERDADEARDASSRSEDKANARRDVVARSPPTDERVVPIEERVSGPVVVLFRLRFVSRRRVCGVGVGAVDLRAVFFCLGIFFFSLILGF